MKRIAFFLIGLLLNAHVAAFDETYVVSINDLEKLTLKVGALKLNNFYISEQKSLTSRIKKMEFSFSALNKDNKNKHFSVMAVGISENKIIWATSAEPKFGTLPPKKVRTIKADPFLSKNNIEKTQKIWLRVIGDFDNN